MSELPDLRELRAGATGAAAYLDSAEQVAELRRQRGQLTLDATTPLARDAAMAYREVLGDRREREHAADSASRPPGGSEYH